MKTKRLLLSLVLCALIMTGCASRAQSAVYDSGKSYDGNVTSSLESPSAAAMPEDMSFSAAAGGSAQSATDATADESNQMIVKNATLSILVDDPSQSLSDIMQMASDMGGYTVSSSRYRSYSSSGDTFPAANVVIRVPADKLNTAMDQIKAMTGDAAKYVTNESVTGEDVTKAYTDLQSRLRNLQQAADELSKMYEKAEKADDVLAIYNQKMQVTEQIEVIKGQMQYYEEASATSSITIDLEAKASVQPITVAGWQPTGIMRDALQALVNFLKGFVNFLIYFVIVALPILAIIGLPIFFFVRWLVRRSKAKKANRNQQPPLPTVK